MVDPYIGQIMPWAGNFAPRNWAFCDGQFMAISQNDALFSIIGTMYGGDGHTTFALPDLRGRMPIHFGDGPGLTPRQIGQRAGTETAFLDVTQIPSHNHVLTCNSGEGDQQNPSNNYFASGKIESLDTTLYEDTATTTLSQQAVTAAGAGQAHTNMPPFIAINYCIALYGVYPPRS